jgi:phosphoserine phosphatase
VVGIFCENNLIMKSLNVIDLDKTLISVDSFREFILKHMGCKTFFWVLLRLFQVVGRQKFAQSIMLVLQEHLDNEKETDEFVRFLHEKIDDDVLVIIKEYSDENTLTVLLSSSPQQYVEKFAKLLGFSGLGSYWRKSEFFHCYGGNKIKLLEENYPRTEYNYNFAISDSESDTELLKMFKNYRLYKGHK